MSEFKKGDIVNLKNTKQVDISKHEILEVVHVGENHVTATCGLFLSKSEIDVFSPTKDNSIIDLSLGYQTSNRYKIHKAASATGFSLSKLSRAMGRSDTYISNESKESRFNSRGDLTDKRYNKLIIDLAYAECALNGNPAKVVDDSIDVEADELTECIEKRFELVEKEAVPTFTPKQKIKSKTEVNKSIVWFILFILVVVILMLVAGIYKSIF